MPRKQHYYEPDQIDCDGLCRSIVQEFSCVPRLDVAFSLDRVIATCRCLKVGGDGEGVVQVQAVCKAPLKGARSAWVLLYSALLDCWHQLDRGTLAVASKPIQHEWNGRPKVPGRTQR